MEIIELKSKKGLINSKITSYNDLESYLQDKGYLYKKEVTVYSNYSVDMQYLTKDGLNILTKLVNSLERDIDTLKQLVQCLYVTTKTYSKPFEITVSAYVDNLKIYPIECLKEILAPKLYNEFPTLTNVLTSIRIQFPLIEQVIDTKKDIFKVDD